MIVLQIVSMVTNYYWYLHLHQRQKNIRIIENNSMQMANMAHTYYKSNVCCSARSR